jgi:hypothetical protein
MLHEVKDGGLVCHRRTLLGRRWRLSDGRRLSVAEWRTRQVRALLAAAAHAPTLVLDDGARRYWLFEERVYRESEELGAEDVLALVREREQRGRRRLQRAHAALAREAAPAAGTPRRTPIPREVRLAVFTRDGGRCVECGSRFELQFDHVIPVSLGGSGGAENLQVLCAGCNQRKGASVA